MDLSKFNFTEHQMILAVTCSAISFAITHIVKPFWKSYFGQEGKDKAASITKLCAVLVGGLVGWSLTYKIVDMWLGMALEAMNAMIVKYVKNKLGIKKEEEKESDPAL